MSIMLKIRWDIAAGRENDFRENQQRLCTVMRDDHPGVVCYHVDYPAPGVSEWVEIYANDAVFKAHLANEKGKGPLGDADRRLREDHLPLLGRSRRRIEEDPRGLRHHVPRHRAGVLRPAPAGRPGVAGLTITQQHLHALAGIAGLLAIAWLRAESRRDVPWRAVGAGLVLQLALALLFLKLPYAKNAFLGLNDVMLVLEKATQAGTALVFGYLGGGTAPFAETDPGSSFILAFRALPLVLVISALSALLFHWRVLPPWCAASPGCWSARCASAAWSASRPRRTCSSAWSRRRCSCGRTSRASRAASCSRS